MATNPKKYRLNHVHTNELAATINAMTKTVKELERERNQTLASEIKPWAPEQYKREKEKEIREHYAKETYKRIKELREHGREQIPDIEGSIRELRAEMRDAKGPQSSAEWSKAANMRPTIRRKIEDALDDPDELMTRYQVLDDVGKAVFLEEAKEILEKHRGAAIQTGNETENQDYFREAASYERAWERLEREHFGELYEVHQENVEALEILQETLEQPYGELDDISQRNAIYRRMGVSEVKPSYEQEEPQREPIPDPRSAVREIVE
jgi:hypothetical protein